MKAIVAGVFCAASMIFSQTALSNGDDLATAVTTTRDMVVTANPLATAAGVKVLADGGTAVDAMVAVQAVLGLVEPQSSGLGGGAFAVYYDAATGETTTFDGREKAPAAATELRFDGLSFLPAWQSGLAVGVPGTPRLMEDMHRLYGQLPWRSLFDSAISLATDGFALTERTSTQVARLLSFNESCTDRLFFRDPAAFDYFAQTTGDGSCQAKPAGTLVQNEDYADTLLALTSFGANAFYFGNIATQIVQAVQGDLNLPGDMTLDDLANYSVIMRRPVCIEYRGYNVCGMGPPSSGAVAVGQILGILENFDLDDLEPLSVETVHAFTQAGRLAFADRGQYLGDSDFVSVPVEGLLDKTYLATRAGLIGPDDMGSAEAGTPPDAPAVFAADSRTKDSGTSHISIVDQYGNAISMTTTIESSFGNGVMVSGFLLNNELTDFAFTPTDDSGTPRANRVQPNKRPRSSMSPTIVLDDDNTPRWVTGSPGGSRIIGYTAQSVMNMIDFDLDPQAAINVPHFMNRNGSTDIEMPIDGITLPYDAEALKVALEARGHSVNIRELTSGLSIIAIDDEVLTGGADFRRDGAVGGNSTSDDGPCSVLPDDDECRDVELKILTTPDKVGAGNYGWVLFPQGTKQWIDAACRTLLESEGVPLVVQDWAEIFTYTDSEYLACDDVIAFLASDDDERPRILVTPDKVSLGNYGWVLFDDGTKQWVDALCRSDLSADGLQTQVLEWIDIDSYPDGPFMSCKEIAAHDGEPGATEFPHLLVTPDRVAADNYGWVLYEDGTKHWVDATCRGTLEAEGVDVKVREWDRISTYSDRPPVDCDSILPDDA